VSRARLFALLLAPFVLLATFNSAGYRYGASDQAFYVPAILDDLDPSLFPRDSDLIESQATLTVVDETVAAADRALPVDLPVLLAGLYVAALGVLAWGALSLAGTLYRTSWAAVALLAALTLRHAIAKTGTNTLEGYFHPRQLAFALGILAMASFLRHGRGCIAGRMQPEFHHGLPGLPALALVVCAALVHPTTALWFVVWLGVSAFVAEPRLRAPLAIAGGAGAIAGVWALTLGPLQGRLAAMDPEWLATLTAKDYLFPLEWPPYAWLVNLGYAPLVIWIHARRRRAGVAVPREGAVVAGALALLLVFAAAVALHPWRIALAIQLQPARTFWMLDFLATVYVVWLLAEGGPAPARRRAMAAAGIVIALTAARSAYVAAVRFPERSIAAIDIPQSDWGRVMAWARSSSSQSSHWLADPVHAARYGTSLRVAGHRDVFVEEIKDTAIGMYSRPVAMRTRERLQALGHFGTLDAPRARALASRYGLDYMVSDRLVDLPVAFRAGGLTVYRLK